MFSGCPSVCALRAAQAAPTGVPPSCFNTEQFELAEYTLSEDCQ